MVTIVGIGESLLKIGHAVATQLARKWIAERARRKRRGRDLADLLATRFPLRGKRREFDRALLGVEDQVAERLTPIMTRAAHGLPDHERNAALDAVADALIHADLTDPALFGADLDPHTVADRVRDSFPVEQAGLSEQAMTLYLVATEQACIMLTHMVRELPEFDAATAVETLTRLTSTLSKLDQLLARVPVPDLDAPNGPALDEQFKQRYRELIGRTYDQLDVVGLTVHHYEPRTTLTVAYLSLTVLGESGQGSQRARQGYDAMDGWQGNGTDESPTANLRVEAALGSSKRTVIVTPIR
jgi:hypothetical protein